MIRVAIFFLAFFAVFFAGLWTLTFTKFFKNPERLRRYAKIALIATAAFTIATVGVAFINVAFN